MNLRMKKGGTYDKREEAESRDEEKEGGERERGGGGTRDLEIWMIARVERRGMRMFLKDREES